MYTNKHGIPVVDLNVPGFIEHLEYAFSDPANICDRSRPYSGQMHTDTGERGKQKVSGITMRDIRDALLMSLVDACPWPMEVGDEDAESRYVMEHFHDDPTCQEPICKLGRGELTADDIFRLNLGRVDPIAIAQNLTCRIEKAMGIYPNVPECSPTVEEIIEELYGQDE